MTTATTGLKLKTYRNDYGHEFQAVEIDGVLVSLSKKDMSNSRNFLAKARVYGAVDVLAADLSALEPAYPYRGSGATDADRLTDKLWTTWSTFTKRVAEQRLSALLAKLVEAGVEEWKFSDNVFKNIKDILTTFASEDGETDLTIYGKQNTGRGEEVQIRISNEDMEGREDIKADAVFVDIERRNW